MRYRYPAFPVLFIALICLMTARALYAQPSGQIPLADALREISQARDIRFSYQRPHIEHIRVPSRIVRETRTAIDRLLAPYLEPAGLTLTPLAPGYFAITRKRDTKAPDHSAAPAVTKDAKNRTLRGYVYLSGTDTPVPYATVSLPALNVATVTDQQGGFQFRNIPSGAHTISAQTLGMVPAEQEVLVPVIGDIPIVRFYLSEEVLSLNEVQVVATEEKSFAGATSSRISRQAIDHLQATSLADVLQLVPGGLASNPNLTAVNQVAVRQVSADRVGSLGTSLIVNGAPVSNNANMQMNNTARSGVLGGFATTAGGGVDFRHFSADDIESVEVIRGIPSVEYGDLTSGAVVVKTKSGPSPLKVTTRINPTLTQFSADKGMIAGVSGGVVNINLDYTRAVSDQRFDVNSFDRYTAGLQYRQRFFRELPLETNSSFTYRANIGQRKLDPDDDALTRNRAADYSYRFNSTGTLHAGKPFAHAIDYTLSVDYTLQKSYQQAMVNGNVYGIATALENVHAIPSTIVPGTYLSQMDVEGKPLSTFAKVTNKFFRRTGAFTHQLLAGAEWRSESNNGSGKVYDITRPPQLQSGTGTRPRSYREIPGLSTFSLYAENRSEVLLAGRKAGLSVGLRYDNMQPGGLLNSRFAHVLSPRVNASYQLTDRLHINAGIGITAKAPTLAYLYPQDAYFDVINLNHYSDHPDERLILVSTHVFNRENTALKVARNTKKEIGVTWRHRQQSVAITAYHERTANGYNYDFSAQTFQTYSVPRYVVSDRPPGQIPVVNPIPARTDVFFSDYTAPANNLTNTNKGIEFDADLGRLDAIRTSFTVNGAWMQTSRVNTDHYFLKRPLTGTTERERVGIYPKGRGTLDQRFNTTVRAIHHLPQFRMVATITAQTIWQDLNRYLRYDPRAIGYLSRTDGQVTWFSPEETAALNPGSMADEEVTLVIPETTYLTESWKPLWLFNVRLTKEFGKNMAFSFFANNVFMHRPLEESTRFADQYTRRNQPLFFGTEFTIKIH